VYFVLLSLATQIYTQPIDINKGIQDADTKRIAELLGFKGKDVAEAQTQVRNAKTRRADESASCVLSFDVLDTI
jgi:hypothetical protein